MRHECVVRPEDLGPLLLGQLPAEEEARVAEAVAGCPSCAAEVRALRPVVTSLGLVSIAAPPEPSGSTDVVAVPVQPGSTEFDRLLASVRAERAERRGRTRRRGALLLAAAAVVLLLAVFGVVALGQDNPGSGTEVTLLGGGAAKGSAVVEQRDWGTAIVLTVRGLPPGRYGAWLQDWSGQRAPAGTFKLSSDGATHLDLSVLMRLQDAAVLGVTRLGGRDVLTHDF